MRTAPLITGLLAAAAIAAPAAHADSIAYVKDGDVWLSTTDGARQFRVTSAGGYSDVSQADDGTMIALHGVRLQRLDRYGTVLADFATPVSDTRPAGQRTFFGPFDPAVSPDGTKVAYTYYYETTSQDASCFPPECVTAINEGGTGYSHADRQTDWDEGGFHQHSGWRNPAWADNDTTMLSDPTHLPNDDVVMDHPGDRAGATGFMVDGWFSDTVGGNPHVSGGDITRAKDKLAFATGDGDANLTLYRVASFPTTFKDGEAAASDRPEVCYRYTGAVGGHFGTPTFSPDGAHAAEAEGDGVHVIDVPDFSGGCTTDGASPSTRLLIPGGAQPDWGPADVPVSRPPASPQPNATVTPGPTATPHPSPTCRVPKVRGLSVTRARRKVAAAGCRVRTRRHGRHVRRQSLKAGRHVALKTTVTLTLGR